jgi:hypothetical protein
MMGEGGRRRRGCCLLCGYCSSMPQTRESHVWLATGRAPLHVWTVEEESNKVKTRVPPEDLETG